MAEEEKEEQKGSEKKNKAILFVIIGVIVVLLLLIGLVVVVLSGGGGEEHIEQAPPPQQAQAPQQQPAKIVVGNTMSVRSTDGINPGLIYPAEAPIAFTVNLMTQTGKRYLKTSIQLELDKDESRAKATAAELDKKSALVKDTIIEILSSKSIEDVATAKGKNRVKDEIVKRLNEFLIDGQVNNIYFVEFVVS